MKTNKLNEQELSPDYPVYWNYLYVADGKVIRSDVQGNIVTLKKDLKKQGISCEVITNCDIEGRKKLIKEATEI